MLVETLVFLLQIHDFLFQNLYFFSMFLLLHPIKLFHFQNVRLLFLRLGSESGNQFIFFFRIFLHFVELVVELRDDFLILLNSVFLFGNNLIFELVLEGEISHFLVHKLDFLFVPLSGLVNLRFHGLFTDANACIPFSWRDFVRTLVRVKILTGESRSSLIN